MSHPTGLITPYSRSIGKLITSICAISILACSLTSASTDHSYFPIKTKDGTEGLSEFEAQWYGKSLERMKEPRLTDFTNDSSVELYRIMILPTWGNSIVVRVRKNGDVYSLSARRLNGQAGYDPGILAEAKNVELTASDARSLDALIWNLHFFNCPQQMMAGETMVMSGFWKVSPTVNITW